MDKCYLCGIEAGQTLLQEGIHKKFGIVKVCRKCFHKEKIPIIEKKDVNMNEVNTRLTVRERLSRMAHIDMEKHESRKIKPAQEDVHLKDLVEQNFKKEVEIGPKHFDDLVDNFNWIIMRKRRAMKLTRSELAEKIKEQQIVIEALEGGSLPRDYLSLVKKVENYLGVRLLKRTDEVKPEEIAVESKVPSGILIEDLKNKTTERKNWFFGRKKKEDIFENANYEETLEPEDIDLEKIQEISGVPEDKVNDFAASENKESDGLETSEKNLDELTDDEINDLIWGKK